MWSGRQWIIHCNLAHVKCHFAPWALSVRNRTPVCKEAKMSLTHREEGASSDRWESFRWICGRQFRDQLNRLRHREEAVRESLVDEKGQKEYTSWRSLRKDRNNTKVCNFGRERSGQPRTYQQTGGLRQRRCDRQKGKTKKNFSFLSVPRLHLVRVCHARYSSLSSLVAKRIAMHYADHHWLSKIRWLALQWLCKMIRSVTLVVSRTEEERTSPLSL